MTDRYVPIAYAAGDATAPPGDGPKIVAHVVNDRGAWGAGFVLAVSRRWPRVETAYRDWHAGRDPDAPMFFRGSVQFVEASAGPVVVVANMLAQRGTRSKANPRPLDIPALAECLARVRDCAPHPFTVHMPRIGCGLAGGTWAEVGPVVERELSAYGVPVTVYDLAPPA